jgi:hypothetical protein
MPTGDDQAVEYLDGITLALLAHALLQNLLLVRGQVGDVAQERVRLECLAAVEQLGAGGGLELLGPAIVSGHDTVARGYSPVRACPRSLPMNEQAACSSADT